MFQNQEALNRNVLAYHGPINIELISFMANYLKNVVATEHPVHKKLFRVFIELTQNVSYYSARVTEIPDANNQRKGIGWFSLDESEHSFIFQTGNLIRKEHGPILEKNCSEINDLDENALRELKRKTRSMAAIHDVGAHIGLIHTGIISGNPLDYKITRIDDNHSFFNIAVKISKNN